MRRLFVVGATAVIRHNRGKQTPAAHWLQSLREKKPVRLVSVALANKTVRIAWALLARSVVQPIPDRRLLTMSTGQTHRNW